MQYRDITIDWLHHACFRIKGKALTIYTDPYKIKNSYNDADMIFITHDHYDHLDKDSIKKLIKKDTVLIAPANCKAELSKFENEKIFLNPNEVKVYKDVSIRTVPSYNTNKVNEDGEFFHPKEKKNVGYIFTVDGVRVYLAGDTDKIPEMKEIKTDIALLPVSGIYVMTANEAIEAAIEINADLSIPMHYGSGIGTIDDAKAFKNGLQGKLKTEILESIDR